MNRLKLTTKTSKFANKSKQTGSFRDMVKPVQHRNVPKLLANINSTGYILDSKMWRIILICQFHSIVSLFHGLLWLILYWIKLTMQ